MPLIRLHFSVTVDIGSDWMCAEIEVQELTVIMAIRDDFDFTRVASSCMI